jgi:integrase
MASKRQLKSGKWEFVVKRAGLLERPLYQTFLTEAEGDAYCARIEALLDKGIIPAEYQVTNRVTTVAVLVREYERDAHPSAKDVQVMAGVLKARGADPLLRINAAWVDAWITEMKRVDKSAPATIRSKVGALARATDWGMRKGLLTLPDHPFRSLPDGYAQYTKTDEALAGVKRVDVERDRRLEPGEYERIMATLAVGVLPRKQRPLVLEHTPAMRCLFVLAVESAMRLREMYTLTLDQVALPKRTAFLDKTKNGDKRQVPLSTVAVAALTDYLAVRVLPAGHPADLVFPWWDGSLNPKYLAKMSDELSKLFKSVFETAGCSGLLFHDLRHEAVSRLFEKTTLSETQIMKISGHKSQRMLMRYANLRGSDLADRLW